MTIYLDSCVLQDLKKVLNKPLLDLIKADKQKNIYCFSEAHLYDLVRDKSNEKLNDMEFIQTIVDNNCYYYNNGVCFEYITPKEYYNSFEWSDALNFKSANHAFSVYGNVLKLIPLNFSSIISLDQIPNDCPPQFLELLNKTSTFYDFIAAFLGFTDTMSTDQKIYKEFIQYLHKNSLIGNVYEFAGIKGFDGENVTNEEDFLQSYGNYFNLTGGEKSLYDLYIEMYNGLETFGFVKGSPKKQKMMNLINDGRHSFFGGCCDIVVSKDQDFINKTRFLYKAYGLDNLVFTISEFHDYLSESNTKVSSLLELINDMQVAKLKNPERNWDKDGISYNLMVLSNYHYGYFNSVTFSLENNPPFYYFSKYSNRFSKGVLIKQIEYVVNSLVMELGKDTDKKKTFNPSEIVEGEWKGRNWDISEATIDLNITTGLFLQFSSKYADFEE